MKNANKGTGEGRVELSMLARAKTTPVGDGAIQRSSADLKNSGWVEKVLLLGGDRRLSFSNIELEFEINEQKRRRACLHIESVDLGEKGFERFSNEKKFQRNTGHRTSPVFESGRCSENKKRQFSHGKIS